LDQTDLTYPKMDTRILKINFIFKEIINEGTNIPYAPYILLEFKHIEKKVFENNSRMVNLRIGWYAGWTYSEGLPLTYSDQPNLVEFLFVQKEMFLETINFIHSKFYEHNSADLSYL
jgi:hypothetical protein